MLTDVDRIDGFPSSPRLADSDQGSRNLPPVSLDDGTEMREHVY